MNLKNVLLAMVLIVTFSMSASGNEKLRLTFPNLKAAVSYVRATHCTVLSGCRIISSKTVHRRKLTFFVIKTRGKDNSLGYYRYKKM